MKNKLLKSFMLIFVILNSLINSYAIIDYKIVLDTKEQIKLESISIDIKDFSDFQFTYNGYYIWEILSGNNSLNYSYFDIEGLLLYDVINPKTGRIESGGEKKIRLDNKELFIPYYDSANKIIISKVNQSTNEKTKVLEIDVSRFAKNRTITNEIEEEFKKPQQPEVIDEIKPPHKYIKFQDKDTNWIFYSIIVLFIVIAIFFIVLIKRRE